MKKDVNGGDVEHIFSNYKDAINVSEILINRFGEKEDKVVKTKEFTKEVSILWQRLQKIGGNDYATDNMVEFIKCLPEDKVVEIKKAKKSDNGVSKDVNRTKILDALFEDFAIRKNIHFGD